jgi:2-polyprenyl-3-methyl-5-hydroxy-6-metoxy-1,4-benzoquinol methylase
MRLHKQIRSVAHAALGPLATPEFSRIFAWRPLGRRINRDQWSDPVEVAAYEAVMAKGWSQLQRENCEYAERVALAVEEAYGTVLELGAGCGNMTVWLAKHPHVVRVVAVEAFGHAAEAIERLGLTNVEVRVGRVESLSLRGNEHFDTIIACELIEHLYPDEEAAMLEEVSRHLVPGARYVVSTPVGWMDDPYHVRGFSPARLRRHLSRYYGPVEGSALVANYSQVAYGRFRQ